MKYQPRRHKSRKNTKTMRATEYSRYVLCIYRILSPISFLMLMTACAYENKELNNREIE